MWREEKRPDKYAGPKNCFPRSLYYRQRLIAHLNYSRNYWNHYGVGNHYGTKNEKSKDYCKADSEQGVLLFHNNISAGHYSLFRFTDVTELL